MIPDFLMPASWHRAREAQAKRDAERRMPLAVPWSPDMKWQRELNLKASTYAVRSLFKVKTACKANINEELDDSRVTSPHKLFAYREVRLPRGSILKTAYGRERGTAIFDGPVIVPALHVREDGAWALRPWMSMTPMEVMSLRPGTKRAKGRTIVAGLGLGHQLIEVSKRMQVDELVLVERSQELADWLLPHIQPHLGDRKVEVVVGDAYEVLPKMKADVALVDIFPAWGNAWERDHLMKSCLNIKYIWAWGASDLRD